MLQKRFFKPDGEKFPQTVLDAMEFCKTMGQRYLWIDRYCIVQDLPEQKHDQLRAMGIIYHYAYFTIIAAEGDALIGLPGIQTPLKPDARASTFRWCKEAGLAIAILHEPIIEGTLWYEPSPGLAHRCLSWAKLTKGPQEDGLSKKASYRVDALSFGDIL